MLKRKLWELLGQDRASTPAARWLRYGLLGLIFLNVVAAVLGSVRALRQQWGAALDAFEAVSVFVFTLEYLARLWSCTLDPSVRSPILGRLRYALRPMALIDLASFLPFFLPFVGVDLRSLRVLRLFRVLRIAKIGRYYSSLSVITQVLRGKKEELVLTSVAMVMLLLLSSSLLYYCENVAQPRVFSSIPATMWWAVATLTTVGYGDMCPITPIGKLCASGISILGIGMFALPTGILGAGFVEAIRGGKQEKGVCPHCGKALGLVAGQAIAERPEPTEPLQER